MNLQAKKPHRPDAMERLFRLWGLTPANEAMARAYLTSEPENDALLSGWTANPLIMYQEYKDAATNFYINRLPAGTVEFTYTLRPTSAGEYRVPAAKIQSMYAPQFGANSRSELLRVD